jgi:hypothetical protein
MGPEFFGEALTYGPGGIFPGGHTPIKPGPLNRIENLPPQFLGVFRILHPGSAEKSGIKPGQHISHIKYNMLNHQRLSQNFSFGKITLNFAVLQGQKPENNKKSLSQRMQCCGKIPTPHTGIGQQRPGVSFFHFFIFPLFFWVFWSVF